MGECSYDVYAVYVRRKQVNVRLSDEEWRSMRFWAYRTSKSLSDLAREALLEKAATLEAADQMERSQARLEMT